MLVPSPPDLGNLLQRAQDGSEEAAQCLYDCCREPLLAVIRQLLSSPLRKLFDSDDFLLAAFTEIFKRKFSADVLASSQTLWPYLQKIAANKVRDANRKYLLSQRYSISKEVSWEMANKEHEARYSRDLSPYDALLLKELVEERMVDLIKQLPRMLQEIIGLLLQGHNGLEIAQMFEVEPKRVYRAMAWLKRKLAE